MANTKLIPLSEQPDYQAAVGKVAQISAALNRTNDELQSLQHELFRLQSTGNKPDESATNMARALAIAEGSTSAAPVIPTDLQSSINRLLDQRKALQAGLVEANRIADQVATEISRQVASQFKDKHRSSVKRILECLEQLCKANEAEEQVRLELERLGYDRHGLQGRSFTHVGRVDDWTGSPAYYFAKEAKQYLDANS